MTMRAAFGTWSRSRHIGALLAVALGVIGGGAARAAAPQYREVLRLMGSRFELIAVADDTATARQAVEAGITEIRRVEALISSWDPQSQTSAINRNAGVAPVQVDRELLDLIERALKVSALTDGAFDISFASLERVWTFDGSMTTLPDSAAVARSVAKVGYEGIVVDRPAGTVFLTRPGMCIGFGGIGKGYAANRAREVMKRAGASSGVVNAGGDLTAWGARPDGGLWRVAIADPENAGAPLAWLSTADGAIVTSGNYEHFAMIDGVRYAHIIDPRTGWPVTGLGSATVICPDAELADALATAVFVLGPDQGIALIDRLKDIEGLLVTDQGELVPSRGVTLDMEEEPDR